MTCKWFEALPPLNPQTTLWLAAVLFLWLTATASACTPQLEVSPHEPQARSGYHYLSGEEQRLQDDDFANPGLLWVDTGAQLFANPPGSQTACAACHSQASMQGVAARYPRYDAQHDRIMTLEQRINACRVNNRQPAFEWESQNMLALTAWLGRQSLGQPIAPDTSPAARVAAKRGRTQYYQRKGQLNLACAHCHEQNAGRMLRGDRLSEGLPTGYPAYKLDWQTLGSLQRRLRDCNAGVRANQLPWGDPEYVDIELYLKTRAAGLPMETPAVRR